MKSVKIISKTPAGEKALKQEIEDSLKLPKRIKKQFNKQFSKEVINFNPFTVEIGLIGKQTQEMIDKDSFIASVAVTMEKNGAKKDIDYSFEVI